MEDQCLYSLNVDKVLKSSSSQFDELLLLKSFANIPSGSGRDIRKIFLRELDDESKLHLYRVGLAQDMGEEVAKFAIADDEDSGRVDLIKYPELVFALGALIGDVNSDLVRRTMFRDRPRFKSGSKKYYDMLLLIPDFVKNGVNERSINYLMTLIKRDNYNPAPFIYFLCYCMFHLNEKYYCDNYEEIFNNIKHWVSKFEDPDRKLSKFVREIFDDFVNRCYRSSGKSVSGTSVSRTSVSRSSALSPVRESEPTNRRIKIVEASSKPSSSTSRYLDEEEEPSGRRIQSKPQASSRLSPTRSSRGIQQSSRLSPGRSRIQDQDEEPTGRRMQIMKVSKPSSSTSRYLDQDEEPSGRRLKL
jgi:hypothetical protein